ncbi:MAG: M23 family metallopeptidase [Sphingopyxis sp.]|nr:M23 family metallopeptidase [Sphingopyxis sp.]
MTMLAVLQVLLPLAAIVWLAFGRPVTGIDLAIRVVAAVALLVAVAAAGLWLALPRSIVLPLGLLLLGALFVALKRLSQERQTQPPGILTWLGRAVTAAVGAAGVWVGMTAFAGSSPPVRPVDLGFPLGEGRYLVTSGGSTELVNPHLGTLAPAFRDWRGQSYGVDLVRIDTLGFRTHDRTPFARPEEAEAYRIFDTPVIAPCSGRVEQTENLLPDMPVPIRDTDYKMGNHVALRCGALLVVLAHLQQGSVIVSPGTLVRKGDPLAKVGNSGQSDEPHLHIHAQRLAQPGQPLLSGEPVPIRLIGEYPVRNLQYEVR